MSESLLVTDIRSYLIDHAYGSAKATPRRHLLHHLHLQGHSIDDRAMRKAYETMDKVGSCSKGIFFIVTAEDRKIAQGQLHSHAMSELVREKEIRDAGQVGQGELF
jgi:hypothetical protein